MNENRNHAETVSDDLRICTSTPRVFAVAMRIAMAIALGGVVVAGSANAALIEGGDKDDLLLGADDDNVQNPVIQPVGASDQGLSNADVMNGKKGDDLMIGLLGSDIMLGGKGEDVIIGGTEQGTPPNSDIMFGNDGPDINIWRGGDGSDVFIGGRNTDALVMGALDRDENDVPVIVPAVGRHEETGLPTADVTGQNGFCVLEDMRDELLGYDFLVRFFLKSTGVLAVTIRVAEVEQVFCTSETAAAITFADLTEPKPAFSEVSLQDVGKLNETVGQIIR